MSEFDDWFKKRTGEVPESCNWLATFITSDDAYKVEQVFSECHSILVADEVIEELNGMIEIMKGRLPHPAAFYAIRQAKDRLTLITDAQSVGVQEAIKRHRLRN